jgi:dTDP-4-amino-4,6-dideoxygalactose transaminase/RimJ/RimL family protein N-acetyltransferase
VSPADREIPVFQPHIGLDTVKAVTDALHVGWLGMGATTKLFEERLEAYIGGGRRVVATNTGTSALHIALLVAGIGRGDEVITPSFNYVSDHQAITATGAEPVMCDIREDDLGPDPASVEALIGPKTRAILPLHFAGVPCHIDEIYQIARARGLRVIEDATHAFGSIHHGHKIGSRGDLACFSFDPVKVITSIDGGAVVCNGAEEVDQLHYLRFLGVDKDTIERYKNKRAWEYDVVSPGFRYHLTNINASIGVSQLERADEFIASRQRSCRLYNELLAGIPELITPRTDFDGVAPFLYVVRVPADRRADLIEHLREAGVATGIHFMGAHTFAFYRNCRRGDLSVTDRVAGEVLTLPLHSHMPPVLVERVATAIRRFFVRGPMHPMLYLAPAQRGGDDAAALLSWRADPKTQAMFFRPQFSRSDYERTYFEPDAPPAVCIRDDEQRRIAMLRFRRYEQFKPQLPEPYQGTAAYDISVIVSPEARGRHLAHACIRLATDHAIRWGARLLVAEIRPENTASRRAFERAGYEFLDEVEKRIPEAPQPFRVVRLIHSSSGVRV